MSKENVVKTGSQGEGPAFPPPTPPRYRRLNLRVPGRQGKHATA
jgi:hypothetical protein